MNIAILGSDPALLPLVKLIAGSPDHQLTHICEAGELAPEIMRLVPSVVRLASWEDLLLVTSLKIVIVAGAKDDVLTGAKQLATADVPLMLLPATAQDSVFIYELSLIQDANHITLLPYIPILDHPVIKLLREQLASQKTGQVLHLQWERTCHTPTHLLTQKDIERMLLHDVAMLRNVWGDYNQITALYSAMTSPEETSDQFSMATITLAGANNPEVVWRLKPTTAAPSSKLTITTSQGEIILEQNGTDENWVMRDENGIVIESEDQTEFVVPSLNSLLHPEETVLSWGELIRSFETVDATRRSIKRRRTIDLHFETTSERSIFKTQMTAIGCSLLVITLFLFVVVLMVGNLFHPAGWVMHILRGAIFLPLFVFLMMQLFLFITRPASQ